MKALRPVSAPTKSDTKSDVNIALRSKLNAPELIAATRLCNTSVTAVKNETAAEVKTLVKSDWTISLFVNDHNLLVNDICLLLRSKNFTNELCQEPLLRSWRAIGNRNVHGHAAFGDQEANIAW